MAVRPDIMIEVDSGLIVTTYTRQGEQFVTTHWGTGTSGVSSRNLMFWKLPSAVLDPLVYGAAMQNLVVVVRRANYGAATPCTV